MPRRTLERREPLALDNINPLKGHRHEKVAPRARLKQSRYHKHPCHAVLLTSASRAGSPGPLDDRKRKDGAAQAPPRTALLIRGSKPDPRRVRTGTPDRRVRDDEGTRIRAVPRAHRLEGALYVVFESQRGQLAGGSH
jgi:hypothetical protein